MCTIFLKFGKLSCQNLNNIQKKWFGYWRKLILPGQYLKIQFNFKEFNFLYTVLLQNIHGLELYTGLKST